MRVLPSFRSVILCSGLTLGVSVACGGRATNVGDGDTGDVDGETDSDSDDETDDAASGGDPATGGETAASGGSDPANGTGGTYLTEDYCFDPASVDDCGEEANRYKADEAPVTLLDVTVLGSDARLLGLDGRVAWLTLNEGSGPTDYRVLRAMDYEADVDVFEPMWPEAPGEFEVRHAVSEYDSNLEDDLELGYVSALACDQDKCVVLSAEPNGAELVHLPGTDLPADTQRLAFKGSVPCAFGKRVDCWQNGQFEPLLDIADGAGTYFTHFSLTLNEESSTRRGIAATDAGAVLITDADGEFEMLVPPNSALGQPIVVESNAWSFSVLFDSGAWWVGELGAASSPSPHEVQCFAPGTMQFLYGFPGVPMYAGNDVGALFVRYWSNDSTPDGQYHWCATPAAPTPDLIGVSGDTCGLTTNVFGITETLFIGLNGAPECAIG
ncbi:MAG TPA: hypothetical protein VN764_06345 [Polyangiaceae bacterium]|nr:hypothetical protein [Polyangiaceae bacterium]